MRKPGWQLWVGAALITLGAAAMGWSVWVRAGAIRTQEQGKRWLARPVARATSPKTVRRGAPIEELEVPRLHLSVVVLEGDDERTLMAGAGHILGTAMFPGRGNIGIAGHRDTFFRPLRFIRPDDLITLKTPSGVARYRVSDVEVVSPADVQTLSPRPGRDLTLVTCYPFYFVGPAPKRFIVHARAESGYPIAAAADTASKGPTGGRRSHL